MTKKKKTATNEQELIINRTFDAPRKKVWRTWSKPISTKVAEMDFRPGGK